MRISRVKKGLLIGMIGLVSGCSQLIEKLMPDDVRVGAVARQVRGRYKGFKVNKTIPLYRFQGNKRINDELDFYGRFDFSKGEISASHRIFHGEVEGEIGALGVGVNYFPFDSRALGFELGGEMLYADYEMCGGLGGFRNRVSDSTFGLGLNAGLCGEIPLDGEGRFFLGWGGGWNVGESFGGRAETDFGGWYGGIGVGVNLTGN